MAKSFTTLLVLFVFNILINEQNVANAAKKQIEVDVFSTKGNAGSVFDDLAKAQIKSGNAVIRVVNNLNTKIGVSCQSSSENTKERQLELKDVYQFAIHDKTNN